MLGAVGFIQGAGEYIQGNILTNAVAGTVLADTGQLVGSSYLFGVIGMTEDDSTEYDVEIRNADNTASVLTIRRAFAAGNDDFLFPSKLLITAGQRLRVTLKYTITGDIQATIFLMEVA